MTGSDYAGGGVKSVGPIRACAMLTAPNNGFTDLNVLPTLKQWMCVRSRSLALCRTVCMLMESGCGDPMLQA